MPKNSHLYHHHHYHWGILFAIILIVLFPILVVWNDLATLKPAQTGCTEIAFSAKTNANASPSRPTPTNANISTPPQNSPRLSTYNSPQGYSVEYPSNWQTYKGENTENFYLEWGPPTTEEIQNSAFHPGAEIFIQQLDNPDNLSPEDFAKDFLKNNLSQATDISSSGKTIANKPAFEISFTQSDWPEVHTFIKQNNTIMKISAILRDAGEHSQVQAAYQLMLGSLHFN